MLIDPKIITKFLITVFIITGLFIGYQLITSKESNEDSETVVSEQSYSDEDVATFENGQEDNIIVDDQTGKKIQFNNSFEHTKPGVSSEIIVNASGFAPNEFTIVYVRFAGTEDYIEAGGQEQRADANGNISTRFTITQYGDYEVFLSSNGETFTSPTLTVE